MQAVNSTKLIILNLTSAAFGQYYPNDGVSISNPLQIDSSEFYVFGKFIDKTNKAKYGASQGQYSGGYTNLYVYNSISRSVKNIFANQTILVLQISNESKIYSPYNNQGMRYSAFLKDYIVILALDKDLNADGILDEDDPISLFICKKNGDNLMKVTAEDMNVLSWTYTKDNNVLLVRVQKDSNNDKKFNNEDETLYQIDLTKDGSKIKFTKIDF